MSVVAGTRVDEQQWSMVCHCEQIQHQHNLGFTKLSQFEKRNERCHRCCFFVVTSGEVQSILILDGTAEMYTVQTYAGIPIVKRLRHDPATQTDGIGPRSFPVLSSLYGKGPQTLIEEGTRPESEAPITFSKHTKLLIVRHGFQSGILGSDEQH